MDEKTKYRKEYYLKKKNKLIEYGKKYYLSRINPTVEIEIIQGNFTLFFDQELFLQTLREYCVLSVRSKGSRRGGDTC